MAGRVNGPALVVALVIAVVGPLFVASYSLAMGDPSPRNVPIGVVADPARTHTIEDALDATGADTFRTVGFGSSADAAAALDGQQIYAVVDPGAGSLVVSTASGASVARLVQDAAPALTQALGTPLQVVDAHPLGARDPLGLVLFYLALGATILGFVGAIQTRVNADGMTLRAEVGWDLGRSTVVALLMTLVIGPVLGLESFPVVPVWLVLSATMFVAAMVYSFWRVVVGGKWALLPTWIMFVIIANPSSGGTAAPELLPPLYQVMGRWLPTGATVRALRDLTYFPGHLVTEPFVVLAVWVLVAAAAFVVARRRRFGSGVAGAGTQRGASDVEGGSGT